MNPFLTLSLLDKMMASRKVAIIVESVDKVAIGLWEKIKNANTLRDLK